MDYAEIRQRKGEAGESTTQKEEPGWCLILREKKMDEIQLKEWEEIVGIFKGIEEDEFTFLVFFDSFQLIFNLESYEGKLPKEKLNRVMIGNKISILRTDIPEKPILVRVDKMRENTSAPRKEGEENGRNWC